MPLRGPQEPKGGRSRVRRLGEERKKRWRVPGAWLTVLLVVVVIMVVLAGGLFAYRALFAGSTASAPVAITVEEGESLSSVARKLDGSGAIGNATVFELRARLRGLGTEIKPGEYRIRPGESGGEILTALTRGGAGAANEVSIPEGLTLDQTAARVAASSGVSEAEFSRAARKTGYGYDFLRGRQVRGTEGFLFPKKYEFSEGAPAGEMVSRMLDQYRAETRSLRFGQAPGQPRLTEYEVVTVASLIEREAAGDGERRIIASVIYNRLRDGMPLQIDATVQYALGAPKENLSLRDLKVDSPYNTYERKGLPPGPIASPGLASIRAALNPADTEYRYYVLDRDGEKHTFTQGYKEFLKAKKEAGR
jgi:UPF0755 protein